VFRVLLLLFPLRCRSRVALKMGLLASASLPIGIAPGSSCKAVAPHVANHLLRRDFRRRRKSGNFNVVLDQASAISGSPSFGAILLRDLRRDQDLTACYATRCVCSGAFVYFISPVASHITSTDLLESEPLLDCDPEESCESQRWQPFRDNGNSLG
jgi:hypothetical protein